MKKNTVIWILKQVRGHIPAMFLLILTNAAHALFGVWFALGTRGVIDSAVAGQMSLFTQACMKQLGIIAGILLTMTLSRHLQDRLHADLERHWKKRLAARCWAMTCICMSVRKQAFGAWKRNSCPRRPWMIWNVPGAAPRVS